MLRARVCGVVRGARWAVPRIGSVPGPAPCCPPGAAGDGEAGAVRDLKCCSQHRWAWRAGDISSLVQLLGFFLFPFFYACNENIGQGYIFHPTLACVKSPAAVSNVEKISF